MELIKDHLYRIVHNKLNVEIICLFIDRTNEHYPNSLKYNFKIHNVNKNGTKFLDVGEPWWIYHQHLFGENYTITDLGYKDVCKVFYI